MSLEVMLYSILVNFLNTNFDLSSGLLAKISGNVIISHGLAKENNLELAEDYGTRTSNDVRAVSRLCHILVCPFIICQGTYNFMAVEMENPKHISYPEFSHNPSVRFKVV